MSDPYSQYKELLTRFGVKVTTQRIIILHVIDEGTNQRLTAEIIGERVREHIPAIHQGTVYRTLETLRKHNIISETRFDDRAAEYELIGAHPHHHLICEKCRRRWEVADEIFTELREQARLRYGFSIRADHLALTGICADCEKTQR